MRYIVVNEVALGYVTSRNAKMGDHVNMVIMRVDVLKGGDPMLIDCEVLASAGTYRKATKQDEERFKIHLGL